jgi:hypothetical protein
MWLRVFCLEHLYIQNNGQYFDGTMEISSLLITNIGQYFVRVRAISEI